MKRLLLAVVVVAGLTDLCGAQELSPPSRVPPQLPSQVRMRRFATSVNKMGFDMIGPGMSYSQVCDVLGGEEAYCLLRSDWGRMQRLWVYGNSELVVWFVDDEVEGAAYAPDVSRPEMPYVMPDSKVLTTLCNAHKPSAEVYNEIGDTREEVLALLGCPSLRPTVPPIDELAGTSSSRHIMAEGERWTDGDIQIWVTFNKEGNVNGNMISTRTFDGQAKESHHPTLDKVILVERLAEPEVECVTYQVDEGTVPAAWHVA
jgi:hypothetical protein